MHFDEFRKESFQHQAREGNQVQTRECFRQPFVVPGLQALMILLVGAAAGCLAAAGQDHLQIASPTMTSQFRMDGTLTNVCARSNGECLTLGSADPPTHSGG